MAVDNHCRLLWDGEVMTKWGVEGTSAVLIHESMHVLRRHFERMGNRDPQDWNEACDREINDDQPVEFPLPGRPLMPSDIGAEKGLTAETYYAIAQRRKTEGKDDEPKQKSNVPGCGAKCGGCTGNPTDEEKQLDERDDVPDKVSAAVKEVIRHQVAQDIADQKGMGSVAGGLKGWAEQELKPPKIDWRRRLANVVRGSLNSVAGRVDYTHRKPGRRYYAMRAACGSRTPVSPSMQQPVPRVAVVLDVSGSMSSELGQAESEVLGLVKAAGGTATVYAADTEVRTTVRVRSKTDLKHLDDKGGMGGTSLDVAIRQAVRGRNHDLLVVLTDGYTNWPTQQELRGVKLLAVITPRGMAAPKWMPQVKIEQD
jgi:predicted metal-dependent peptidase